MIDALLIALPFPQLPVEIPTTENWAAIEAQVGRLPVDYKAFVERFGTVAKIFPNHVNIFDIQLT
jgi:hypothetical protein